MNQQTNKDQSKTSFSAPELSRPLQQAIHIAILILVFYFAPMNAYSSVDVIFNSTQEPTLQASRNQLIDNDLESLIEDFANDTFALTSRIEIVFGEGDGPVYDPNENRIYLPYDFVADVTKRFKHDNYEETGVTIEQATQDAIIHTIFHELAHALIANFDLAITGKEEDAADELAGVLLIEHFEHGQEIALSAADLFDLESGDKESLEEVDFWGEHSLDSQRFYNTICLIYGSAPEQYAHLLDLLDISQDRGDLCIEDYGRAVRSWHTILAPYLK